MTTLATRGFLNVRIFKIVFRLVCTVGLLAYVAGAAFQVSAQEAPPPPGVAGLAGTWILQADAAAARNRRPINGISIATRLIITVSPTEVAMDSNTGTDNAIVSTVYKLNGGAHAIPGPIGWDTRAISAMDAGRFVVSVRRSVQGPEGELVFEIREVYSVTGDTLTLERTQRKTVQTLVYKRG